MAVSTSAQAAPQNAASRLGFTAGQVIQEFGYDSDVDDQLRFAIEDLTTTDLEDEDYGDVADAVLIWWRNDDGDLVVHVEQITGADQERIDDFFRYGMWLNVAAAMGVEDLSAGCEWIRAEQAAPGD